jgi:putative chitinase
MTMTNVPAGAAISLALIETAVGKKLTVRQKVNANSVVAGLTGYGAAVGLGQPHRLAQYLAQLMHESGTFNYDRELWGPTAAQKRYEGRKDLGNTVKGDGSKYRGRGPIQITGRANYRAFTAWARKLDAKAPNFESDPDAVNTDPWEGLGPIWFWDSRGLNRYADAGDVEMVTRKINGGLNGLDDRIHWLVRVSLSMLGYAPDAVAAFQAEAGEKADGIAGPRTRAALHKALVALTAPVAQSGDVQAAPVVEEKTVEVKVPVAVNQPVVPETVDKAVKKQTNGWGWSGIGLGGAGAALTAIAGWPWQTIALFAGLAVVGGIVALVIGPWIVGRVKVIRAAVEG